MSRNESKPGANPHDSLTIDLPEHSLPCYNATTVRPYGGHARPYRFGVTFGVLTLVVGTYYGWLAIARAQSILESFMLGLSSVLALSTGIGLLGKRPYGLVLLYLGLVIGTVTALAEWFERPGVEIIRLAPVNLAMLALAGAVALYFHKRRKEFSPIHQGVGCPKPERSRYSRTRIFESVPQETRKGWVGLLSLWLLTALLRDLIILTVLLCVAGEITYGGRLWWVFIGATAIYWFVSRRLEGGTAWTAARLVVAGLVLKAIGLTPPPILTFRRAAAWTLIFFMLRVITSRSLAWLLMKSEAES